MATIQVRNIPDEAVRRWKVRAARSGQSLQEYMCSFLTDEASKPTLEELFERIDDRAAGDPNRSDLGASEVVDMIRDEREARDRHLEETIERFGRAGDGT